MGNFEEVYKSFSPIWDDIVETRSLWSVKPLLAHYTSIATLEQIILNDELWFSNPLYMNDNEEVRFGLFEGANALRRNAAVRDACGSEARYNILAQAFEQRFEEFGTRHVLDTYVLCFAEHDPADTDGVLSMWRGYGSNGNGAALILNPSPIRRVNDSPLIMEKVTYQSHEQRLGWIDQMLMKFANLLNTLNIPDELLNAAAAAVFERLKIFALFTKHHGFREEREWRAVYLRERDRNGYMDSMLDYAIGRNGVEPKLKFKVKAHPWTVQDLSLESLIHQIILGPLVSGTLTLNAVRRMLEKAGKPSLAAKLISSTTPFRASL